MRRRGGKRESEGIGRESVERLIGEGSQECSCLNAKVTVVMGFTLNRANGLNAEITTKMLLYY